MTAKSKGCNLMIGKNEINKEKNKINKKFSGSCGEVGARRRPVTGAAALSQRDYSCLFDHLHVLAIWQIKFVIGFPVPFNSNRINLWHWMWQ